MKVDAWTTGGAGADTAAPPFDNPSDAHKVDMRMGVRIPMRDGVQLNAILYLPREASGPCPAVFSFTPYIAQLLHPRGVYFAARGFAYVTVDVRGRGDSEGEFTPYKNDPEDGYDIIEWIAQQPFCNGKISAYGGSYLGLNQWLTARERPPHLTSIIPVASPFAGVDFPMRKNVAYNYILTWSLYVSGKSLKQSLFDDASLWTSLWQRRAEAGLAFETLGEEIGFQPDWLREWIAHPTLDSFYASLNPTAEDYAAIDLPILTITGHYDADQPGALEHYRRHMAAAGEEARARHFLVIGPWDHAGTRVPNARFGGLTFGPESLVDILDLHTQWYRWTLESGPRPDFLKDRVAWYVTGAERWRYAPAFEAVTSRRQCFHLASAGSAGSVTAAGTLDPDGGPAGGPDTYVYDPRDLSRLSRDIEPMDAFLTDQRGVYGDDGKQLVYHSARFAAPVEITGFFELEAWIAIDRPDTDFLATVYEIRLDGSSIHLADDMLRARHRESLSEETLVTTSEPLLYTFDRFTFISRQIARHSRLRLVISPLDHLGQQKNYNSAKPVSRQTLADGEPVTVRLFHDRERPSALHVPIGKTGDEREGADCSL